MVNFLIGHNTYRMFPPDILSPPSGELVFCFCGMAAEVGRLRCIMGTQEEVTHQFFICVSSVRVKL